MNRPRVVTAAIFLALACNWAGAQEPVDTSKYVSREEYETLKKQMEALQAEVAAMHKTNVDAEASAEREEMMDELADKIKQIQNQANFITPGTTKFFLAGDAAMNFSAVRHSPSTFGAEFNPLFLVQMDDRLFFEGGLDIAGSTNPDDQSSSTTVGLSEANVSYLINKNLIVGGGWFTLQFSRFHNNYDASWINRLPDAPLPFGDRGIAPSNGMGLYGEGAAPLGKTQINYAAYVINGPSEITNKDNAGTLNFDSFDDLNNNKAVGSRVGWQPTTGSEIGYSIMCGDVNPNGFQRVHGLLQAVDGQYRKEFARIYGTIDARAEWVWSNVSEATFDPTGALMFGPLRFDNNRNGGYVQLSYRPTVLKSKILRNLEPVIRYDTLQASSQAPGGGNENRMTFGLDYWVKANAVFKIAYECDDMETGPDQNAFLVQFGIGL